MSAVDFQADWHLNQKKCILWRSPFSLNSGNERPESDQEPSQDIRPESSRVADIVDFIVLPGVHLNGQPLFPPFIGVVRKIKSDLTNSVYTHNSPNKSNSVYTHNSPNLPVITCLEREKVRRNGYIHVSDIHDRSHQSKTEVWKVGYRARATEILGKSYSWNSSEDFYNYHVKKAARKSTKKSKKTKRALLKKSASAYSQRKYNPGNQTNDIQNCQHKRYESDLQSSHELIINPLVHSTTKLTKNNFEFCHPTNLNYQRKNQRFQTSSLDDLSIISVTYNMEDPAAAGEHSKTSDVISKKSEVEYDPLYKCAFEFAKSRGCGFVEFVEDRSDSKQTQKLARRRKLHLPVCKRDERVHPVSAFISNSKKFWPRREKCLAKPKRQYFSLGVDKMADDDKPKLKHNDSDIEKAKMQSPTYKTSCPDLMKEFSPPQRNRHRIYSKTKLSTCTHGSLKTSLSSPEDVHERRDDVMQSLSLSDFKDHSNTRGQRYKRKNFTFETISTRSRSTGVGDVLNIPKVKSKVVNEPSNYRNKSHTCKAGRNISEEVNKLELTVNLSKNMIINREIQALDTNTSKKCASDSDEMLWSHVSERRDNDASFDSVSSTSGSRSTSRSGLKSVGSGLRAFDSGLQTSDSRFKPIGSGLRTPNSGSNLYGSGTKPGSLASKTSSLESVTSLPHLREPTSLQYKLCNSLSATIFRETQMAQKSFTGIEYSDKLSSAKVDVIHFTRTHALIDDSACAVSVKNTSKASVNFQNKMQISQGVTDASFTVNKTNRKGNRMSTNTSRGCSKWRIDKNEMSTSFMIYKSDELLQTEANVQGFKSKNMTKISPKVGDSIGTSEKISSRSVDISTNNEIGVGTNERDLRFELPEKLSAEICPTRMPEGSEQCQQNICSRTKMRLDSEATEGDSCCTSSSSRESEEKQSDRNTFKGLNCDENTGVTVGKLELNNNKNNSDCKDDKVNVNGCSYFKPESVKSEIPCCYGNKHMTEVFCECFSNRLQPVHNEVLLFPDVNDSHIDVDKNEIVGGAPDEDFGKLPCTKSEPDLRERQHPHDTNNSALSHIQRLPNENEFNFYRYGKLQCSLASIPDLTNQNVHFALQKKDRRHQADISGPRSEHTILYDFCHHEAPCISFNRMLNRKHHSLLTNIVRTKDTSNKTQIVTDFPESKVNLVNYKLAFSRADIAQWKTKYPLESRQSLAPECVQFNKTVEQCIQKVKGLSKQTVNDLSKQTVNDSSKQTVSDLSKQTLNDLSKQTVSDLSKQTVNDSSKQTVSDLSKQTLNDLSKQTVNDLSKQTVSDLSKVDTKSLGSDIIVQNKSYVIDDVYTLCSNNQENVAQLQCSSFSYSDVREGSRNIPDCFQVFGVTYLIPTDKIKRDNSFTHDFSDSSSREVNGSNIFTDSHILMQHNICMKQPSLETSWCSGNFQSQKMCVLSPENGSPNQNTIKKYSGRKCESLLCVESNWTSCGGRYQSLDERGNTNNSASEPSGERGIISSGMREIKDESSQTSLTSCSQNKELLEELYKCTDKFACQYLLMESDDGTKSCFPRKFASCSCLWDCSRSPGMLHNDLVPSIDVSETGEKLKDVVTLEAGRCANFGVCSLEAANLCSRCYSAAGVNQSHNSNEDIVVKDKHRSQNRHREFVCTSRRKQKKLRRNNKIQFISWNVNCTSRRGHSGLTKISNQLMNKFNTSQVISETEFPAEVNIAHQIKYTGNEMLQTESFTGQDSNVLECKVKHNRDAWQLHESISPGWTSFLETSPACYEGQISLNTWTQRDLINSELFLKLVEDRSSHECHVHNENERSHHRINISEESNGGDCLKAKLSPNQDNSRESLRVSSLTLCNDDLINKSPSTFQKDFILNTDNAGTHSTSYRNLPSIQFNEITPRILGHQNRALSLQLLAPNYYIRTKRQRTITYIMKLKQIKDRKQRNQQLRLTRNFFRINIIQPEYVRSSRCTNNNNSNKSHTNSKLTQRSTLKKSRKYQRYRMKTPSMKTPRYRARRTMYFITQKGRKLILRNKFPTVTYSIGSEGHKRLYEIFRRRYNVLHNKVAKISNNNSRSIILCSSCNLVNNIMDNFQNIVTKFPERRLRNLQKILVSGTKSQPRVRRSSERARRDVVYSHTQRKAIRDDQIRNSCLFNQKPRHVGQSFKTSPKLCFNSSTSKISMPCCSCCSLCRRSNIKIVDSLVTTRKRLAKTHMSMPQNVSKNACYMKTWQLKERNGSNKVKHKIKLPFTYKNCSQKLVQINPKTQILRSSKSLLCPTRNAKLDNEENIEAWPWLSNLKQETSEFPTAKNGCVLNNTQRGYCCHDRGHCVHNEFNKQTCDPKSILKTSTHVHSDSSWLSTVYPRCQTMNSYLSDATVRPDILLTSQRSRIPLNPVTYSNRSKNLPKEINKPIDQRHQEKADFVSPVDVSWTSRGNIFPCNGSLQHQLWKVQPNCRGGNNALKSHERIEIMKHLVNKFFSNIPINGSNANATKKRNTGVFMNENLWNIEMSKNGRKYVENLDVSQCETLTKSKLETQHCDNASLSWPEIASTASRPQSSVTTLKDSTPSIQSTFTNGTSNKILNTTANHSSLEPADKVPSKTAGNSENYQGQSKLSIPYFNVNCPKISTRWMCFFPKIPPLQFCSRDFDNSDMVIKESNSLSNFSITVSEASNKYFNNGRVILNARSKQQNKAVDDVNNIHDKSCTSSESWICDLKDGPHETAEVIYHNTPIQNPTGQESSHTVASSTSSLSEACSNNNNINRRVIDLGNHRVWALRQQIPVATTTDTSHEERTATATTSNPHVAAAHIREPTQRNTNIITKRYITDAEFKGSRMARQQQNMWSKCGNRHWRSTCCLNRGSPNVLSEKRKRTNERSLQEVSPVSKIRKLSVVKVCKENRYGRNMRHSERKHQKRGYEK